jgi:methyl-accepting chemotaxis protein
VILWPFTRKPTAPSDRDRLNTLLALGIEQRQKAKEIAESVNRLADCIVNLSDAMKGLCAATKNIAISTNEIVRSLNTMNAEPPTTGAN